MKINYELTEKIGATHYNQSQGTYVKIHRGTLHFYDLHSESWIGTVWDSFHTVKPIPKPRTRTEYEKVSFVSVGDCVQSVHDNYGEYFFLNSCSGEYQAAEYQDSAWYWKEGNLYRKVEKEIDWREEVRAFLKKPSVDGKFSIDKHHITIDCTFSESELLELCRVALRANGEIE